MKILYYFLRAFESIFGIGCILILCDETPHNNDLYWFIINKIIVTIVLFLVIFLIEYVTKIIKQKAKIRD